MANKREFKKSVEALTSALVDEMMASYYNVKEADRDKIATAITKVVAAMEQAKRDSNALFGKKLKEFENISAYNKAKSKFIKAQYEAAVEKYNNALGEALKAYNEGMPKNEVDKA